ncbi:hypothetical protein CMUS01_05332 [Colletotrichum musicola]|uniref:Uncharacterized protein n=1 Tax=Colletotrichum musicola TaxID=2175873 RepID=A0A8H6NKY3_9PEZI|nr:hypothetical protein CMUS01_05332 [Colletotrichum musicola]
MVYPYRRAIVPWSVCTPSPCTSRQSTPSTPTHYRRQVLVLVLVLGLTLTLASGPGSVVVALDLALLALVPTRLASYRLRFRSL